MEVEHAESCESCGFVWSSVAPQAIVDRLLGAGSALGAVFGGGDASFITRSSPGVWSRLEYGCHVRDVLLNLRDRIIVGAVEDNPTTKPMYRQFRIEQGMYAADTPEDLTVELPMAANLLARTIGALSPKQLSSPMHYPWPRPTTRTVQWVAAQALHEAEHHLTDIR